MKNLFFTLTVFALLNIPSDAPAQEAQVGISSSQMSALVAHSLSIGPAFRYWFRDGLQGPFIDTELEIGVIWGSELDLFPLTGRSGLHWGWQFESGIYTAVGATNWFTETPDISRNVTGSFAAGFPLPTGQVGWKLGQENQRIVMIGLRVETLFVGFHIKVLE